MMKDGPGPGQHWILTRWKEVTQPQGYGVKGLNRKAPMLQLSRQKPLPQQPISEQPRHTAQKATSTKTWPTPHPGLSQLSLNLPPVKATLARKGGPLAKLRAH
jgi:hypothetical protein